VNGDGTLEWEEFSDHIIQLGLIKKEDNGISDIIKKYHYNDKIKESTKHETEISKLYFFEPVQYIVCLEVDSPCIKIYNSFTLELIYTINKTKGTQLFADYIEDNNMIVTTTNAKTI